MSYYLVSSGVVSSGIMLTMDDWMSVLDTGLAEYTTVNSGGWLTAQDSGMVMHTTVNSNGFFQITNGGMAHDTEINFSGSMAIFSGGTASETTLNGGDLYVSGGVIVSTTVSGNDFRSYLGVSSGGVAVSTTVTGEDARMILRSGCTAISTVIDQDGYMRLSGGSADGITIGPGATLEVKNGGTATNVTWTPTEGEIEIEDGSTISFTTNYTGVYLGKNDHLLSHSIVMNGLNIGDKTMAVMPGGTANSCTVGPEGCVSVWMGASIDHLTVSGGELLVFSGGTATNVIWTPTEGNVYFYDGAVVTYVSSYSGVYYGSNGHLLSNTAMMSGKTVDENSNMHVFNGGMAVSTVIDDDGEMLVWSGGIARSTTLSGDGEMHLNAGGIAELTQIMDGGLDVDSGAVANDTSIYNDGNLEISGGAVASNTMVFGGHFEVDDGAAANNTTVSGGALQISRGGIANSNTIFSGGYLHVWGGTANLTTVNSDGQLSVNSSGMANNTSVNGGWLWAIGGTANNTTLNSGGELSVERGGTANGTIVNNSGVLFVDSFGTANDTTINSNGQLSVNSGGMVTDTAVNSGIMQVFFSGTAINTTVNSGGDLQTMGGKLTGSLEIASGAVVSMSDFSILDFDISGRTADSSALVNDLSLISGTPTYTITVSADQAAGDYTLAGGAADFTGTVSIGTDGFNYGTLTVNGDALNYGDYTFALTTSYSDLLLTVCGGPAPVGGSVAGDLNADGRADIVMTIAQDGHAADGSTGAWLIQNDQTAAWGDLSTRNPGWEIFGTGRTAAGKATDDVYIKSSDNVVGAWTTADDGKVNGWETIGEFSADTQIVGLGDFNGNGQTDLLLRNTNGAVGCFFTGGETTGWNYFQSLGDEWKLSAVGDLNGDGRDDVVLKHDAGFAGSWLTQADGTMAWADLDTLPEGFEIVGAGDFNGDGTDDVLLKSGNYYGAWLVNNGNAAGWMGLGDLGDVTVEQIADFNGDGTDDLRIRTSAGDLGAQLVMGEDSLSWKYYGSVGSEWSTSLAALA